jgi:hypothetical protein
MGHSHSIYVLGSEEADSYDWRAGIYQKIDESISKGYAVVYIGEGNETLTIQHFRKMGLAIEDHIEAGSLTIINKNIFYSPSVPSNVLLEQWTKIFHHIEKKAGKGAFKGIVCIGMPPDTFFDSELNKQRAVDYETLVAEKYDESFEAICLYAGDIIEKMSLKHIIGLVSAHQNTIHKDGQLRPWNTQRGVAAIRHGLDIALEENVAGMVFSVLVRDFGMSEEALVLHPEHFEKKLQILLGTSAAEIVISRIKMELRKEITF